MLDWFECGDISGRVRVADRKAIFVHGSLGEGHRELDLPGMGSPAGTLTGPAFGVGRYGGRPGATERPYSFATGVVEPSGASSPLVSVAASAQRAVQQARPSASAQRSARLVNSFTPGKLGDQVTAFGEGDYSSCPVHHSREPRGERGAGYSKLLIAWRYPVAVSLHSGSRHGGIRSDRAPYRRSWCGRRRRPPDAQLRSRLAGRDGRCRHEAAVRADLRPVWSSRSGLRAPVRPNPLHRPLSASSPPAPPGRPTSAASSAWSWA